jgi:hypothetical protein
LPLAVFVQGTGCESHFWRDGGKLRACALTLLYDAARGRARVLAVEKPGVRFLDRQHDAANARNCRAEVLAEHTLDLWAEAISTAIKAAQELPGSIAREHWWPVVPKAVWSRCGSRPCCRR